MDGKAVNDPLTGALLNRNSKPSDQLRDLNQSLVIMIRHRFCEARHALLVAGGGHCLLFERRSKIRRGKATCDHKIHSVNVSYPNLRRTHASN